MQTRGLDLAKRVIGDLKTGRHADDLGIEQSLPGRRFPFLSRCSRTNIDTPCVIDRPADRRLHGTEDVTNYAIRNRHEQQVWKQIRQHRRNGGWPN